METKVKNPSQSKTIILDIDVENDNKTISFTPPTLKQDSKKSDSYQAEKAENNSPKKSKGKKVFLVRTLGETLEDARNAPPAKKLVGDLITEGEQVILFGDTNTGKSLFAMQMAMAISKGESLTFSNAENDIILENQCEAKRVLYIDLEHSDQQLEKRINLDALDEESRSNIFLAKVDIGEMLEGNNPGETFQTIKEAAEQCQAKFIVIDNISAISGDLEKGENAKQFLSPLWRLCRNENYTIVILAHTPKLSNQRFILTLNNIAGSKKLPALVDSVIGIAEQVSNEEGHIYIKQLKARTGEKKYGMNNVLCGRIRAINGTVQHVITHTANEYEAIGKGNEGEAKFATLQKSALAYLQGGNLREAAKIVGIGKDAVSRHVKKLQKVDPQLFEQMQKMNPQELKDYAEGAELLASQKTNYPR